MSSKTKSKPSKKTLEQQALDLFLNNRYLLKNTPLLEQVVDAHVFVDEYVRLMKMNLDDIDMNLDNNAASRFKACGVDVYRYNNQGHRIGKAYKRPPVDGLWHEQRYKEAKKEYHLWLERRRRYNEVYAELEWRKKNPPREWNPEYELELYKLQKRVDELYDRTF